MEEELVGGSSSVKKESSEDATLFSVFLHEMFPVYLHYGMTYEQYWNENCSLAEDYRVAHELKMQEENQQLWAQGFYIYHALLDVAPAYSLKLKANKVEPYLAEPIPLSEKEKRKQDERQTGQMIADYMNSFMAIHNKKGGDEECL